MHKLQVADALSTIYGEGHKESMASYSTRMDQYLAGSKHLRDE